MTQHRKTVCHWAASILILSLLLLAAPRQVLAAVSESEAVGKIESSYGVRALKVRSGEVDGRAVWLVTVMNPGGDSNAAFQVNTLAVDKETGDLVPSFRHGASGYVLPDAIRRDDKVGRSPDTIRSRAWR